MATDSVLGLFTDPAQYAQQQSAGVDQRAAQFAQMTPLQQAQFGIYGGANRVAGGLAGMLGAQDPQMQLAAMRQQVLKSLDPNDPQSLAQAAQALNQAGDVQGAMQLYQTAQVRAKDLQDIAVKQSQVVRNLREPRAAALPEVAKLQQYRDQLVEQFGEDDTRVKQIDAAIAKQTKQGKTLEETMGAGLGAIAAAMAGAQAKKAAEAGGTEVGKKIADIEGSQSALTAIKGAKAIFDKGIYAGKYGPTMEGLAGYTGGTVGSTERLANTETFRSYLGDVVIPGLKDFGGSDTVEELKYLQGVFAGDTTAQPKALKNMLERAETKIKSKIERIQSQQKAIETGSPLPTGPSNVQAVRTWNPVTRKFE